MTTKNLVSSLFFMMLFIPIYAKDCVLVSQQEFEKILTRHPRPVTLAFFSTWCADCKKEIERVKNGKGKEQTLLIAEFDSIERVNRNLNKMGVDGQCYFDEQGKIKDQYFVKMVPTEILVK